MVCWPDTASPCLRSQEEIQASPRQISVGTWQPQLHTTAPSTCEVEKGQVELSVPLFMVGLALANWNRHGSYMVSFPVGRADSKQESKPQVFTNQKSCLTSHVLLSSQCCECPHHEGCLGFNSRYFKLAMRVT